MQDNHPQVVKLLETMREYKGKDRMVLFEDLVREMGERIRPRACNTKILPSFDEASGGIQEGEVVILGGASNEGKTLLALSLLTAHESQGERPAFFSFEQSVEQIAEKLPAEYTPLFHVPALMDYETRYDGEIEAMKRDPKTYIGKLPSLQLQWLYLKLVELQAKGEKPHAVFIDYLHALLDFHDRNPVQTLGAIMIALKDMALRFKIVIYLICHTVKEALDREPTLSDLRDSGWIINVPDVILLLWREKMKDGEGYSRVSTVKVGKHRRRGEIKGRKFYMTMDARSLLNEITKDEADYLNGELG